MAVRPSSWFGVSAARRADAERSPIAPKPRPELKVLQGGAMSRRDRIKAIAPRVRLFGMVSSIGAILFGVVAFHVVLSQGQFELEGLRSQANEQQAQYERLRLEVAQLESPQRITDEAVNRLGLVPADKVTPVTPDAKDLPIGPNSQHGQTTTSTVDAGQWDKVKPHLSSSSK